MDDKDKPIFVFSIGIFLIGVIVSLITFGFKLNDSNSNILFVIILFTSFLFSYLCLRLIYKKPIIDENKILEKCINAFQSYLKRVEPKDDGNPKKKTNH